MSLSQELNNEINSHTLFNLSIFGWQVPVSDTVVIMWIIMALLMVFSYVFTKKLESVPKGKQNIAEVIVDACNSIAKQCLGKHWRSYAPYLGTVFLFLVMGDMISIFNIIPDSETLYRLTHIEAFKDMPSFVLKPPSENINVTAALALISLVLVLYAALKFNRPGRWLKSFVEPMPVILPFKIMEYFTRPLALALRLFGNVLGAAIFMTLLYFAVKPVVPAAFSLYFDMFDGILQAYVFVFLTGVYIEDVIELGGE